MSKKIRKVERYHGDEQDGKRHGFGTLVQPSRYYFVGHWQQGLRHGTGTEVCPGEYYFVGEWRNDVKHGPGRHCFEDGREFLGDWNKGVCASGTLKYGDGAVYQGEVDVEHWTKHGKGSWTLADGTLAFDGRWYHDQKHGLGYEVSDGVRFWQEWKHGEVLRTLEIRYADGSVYRGETQDQKPHGQGQLRSPDGHTFYGCWRAGQKHGHGRVVNSAGTWIRMGVWEKDEWKKGTACVMHQGKPDVFMWVDHEGLQTPSVRQTLEKLEQSLERLTQ